MVVEICKNIPTTTANILFMMFPLAIKKSIKYTATIFPSGAIKANINNQKNAFFVATLDLMNKVIKAIAIGNL